MISGGSQVRVGSGGGGAEDLLHDSPSGLKGELRTDWASIPIGWQDRLMFVGGVGPHQINPTSTEKNQRCNIDDRILMIKISQESRHRIKERREIL